MAKRKRLNPAIHMPTEAVLETKSRDGLGGYAPRGASAPISDVAGSAASAAALEELAYELHSARTDGRLVVTVALRDVDEGYLVRDRVEADAEDMQSLIDSLRMRGQQAPIDVCDLGGGRFGLISGWRRLTALKTLHKQHPDGGFGTVRCLIRAPKGASQAYVAMVEENEIRSALSFYERARIAARAAEVGVYDTPRAAVKELFPNIPRAKRSKINSFLRLYSALDDVLCFPTHISEKAGLALVKAIEHEAGFEARVRAAYAQQAPETPMAEAALLTQLMRPEGAPAQAKAPMPEGIIWSQSKNKLVLKGTAVNEAFLKDLKAWVEAYK
jgi:hypothetical protein